MNFSSKSLAAVLLVIISLSLGYFVVMPKWNEYSLAKTDLALANTQEKDLKEAQKQLDSFLSVYRAHITDAGVLNQALPLSESELHNVLNDLDTLTRSSGLALAQLTILETPESDQFGAAAYSIQPLDLSISGSGSYTALKNFISGLETNLRIMDISTLNLQTETTDINFSLQFRTYFQK